MVLFQCVLYPRRKKLGRASVNSRGAFGAALLEMAVEIPRNPTLAHILFPSCASTKPKQNTLPGHGNHGPSLAAKEEHDAFGAHCGAAPSAWP